MHRRTALLAGAGPLSAAARVASQYDYFNLAPLLRNT